jgi:hypothetical protein
LEPPTFIILNGLTAFFFIFVRLLEPSTIIINYNLVGLQWVFYVSPLEPPTVIILNGFTIYFLNCFLLMQGRLLP